ncbi:CMRF35-like molecule 5 isoform X2 [Danio aesculapii]|uniref:CMRF35-like molecule 5 isoform X2 n=1 Tax=Danio aesculapii TaxID=1142201 RepID=UPI0024BFFBC3|nr:CMRF35-like molecule 5 isoform X2 [Danio aesculapii]
MKPHLSFMSLLAVLTEVLMKSGDANVGTESGEVEIRCPYPDTHIYKPKYFCREPCRNVLIKAEKTDQVFTTGRYSLYDDVNGRFFTVTIRKLKLTDSGVYYCGLDQWFFDTLTKVHLSVTLAPVSRPLHTTENTFITSNTHTTTLTSTDSDKQSSLTTQTTKRTSNVEETLGSLAVVCAVVLALVVFCVVVALAYLCRKRSDLKSRCLQPPVTEILALPDPNQTAEGVYHIYAETVTDKSPVIYSTVQLCDPAAQDDANTLYSLITPHTV